MPDSAARLARWTEDSAALYQTRPVFRDLRYGSAPRQRLDFFPAGRIGRPTVFFIHGGYWQWGHKENEAFVAKAPAAVVDAERSKIAEYESTIEKLQLNLKELA